MNKIKVFLAVIVICFSTFPDAYAVSYNSSPYGSYLNYPANFDSVTGDAINFVEQYGNGYYDLSISTAEYYRRTRSVAIDYTSGSQYVNFCNNNMTYKSKVLNNSVYAEMYIKGIDFDIHTTVKPILRVIGGQNDGYEAPWYFEEAENGWTKLYTCYNVDESFERLIFGINIDKSSGEDDITTFYMDEMRCIIVPRFVEVLNNIETDSSRIDLNKMRFFGKDSKGRKEEIFATDVVDYEILQGDAYIDEYGRLTAQSPGDVYVKATFFNRSCEFIVTFAQGEGGVYASLSGISEDGTVLASVTNCSERGCMVKLVTVLRDSDKFIKLITSPEMMIEAGSSADITNNVSNVPFYVSNPEYTSIVFIKSGEQWLPVNR